MANARISDKLLNRVRDYAVEEPSYTIAFAAWELKISPSAMAFANHELLRLGIVHKIERRKGPYAAVYAYNPPPNTAPTSRVVHDRPNSAPPAVEVPTTGRRKGRSGTMQGDKKRQARGHQLRRHRAGT